MYICCSAVYKQLKIGMYLSLHYIDCVVCNLSYTNCMHMRVPLLSGNKSAGHNLGILIMIPYIYIDSVLQQGIVDNSQGAVNMSLCHYCPQTCYLVIYTTVNCAQQSCKCFYADMLPAEELSLVEQYIHFPTQTSYILQIQSLQQPSMFTFYLIGF